MSHLSIVGGFAEGACRVTHRLQEGGGRVQSQEEGFKKREQKCKMRGENGGSGERYRQTVDADQRRTKTERKDCSLQQNHLLCPDSRL